MLRRDVRQGKEKLLLFQSNFVGKRVKARGRPDACPRGARTVACRSWSGAAHAAEPAHKRVGILPMRNDSRHEAAPQDEVANACIFNICHTAPVDESPRFPATFCGILYHARCTGLNNYKSILYQ